VGGVKLGRGEKQLVKNPEDASRISTNFYTTFEPILTGTIFSLSTKINK
jgi:hypothetical protein